MVGVFLLLLRSLCAVVVAPSQRADALLEREQRLVDLRALDLRLLAVLLAVVEPLRARQVHEGNLPSLRLRLCRRCLRLARP